MSLMGQGTVSDVGLEPHSDRYSGIALPPDARAPLGGFQTVNQPRLNLRFSLSLRDSAMVGAAPIEPSSSAALLNSGARNGVRFRFTKLICEGRKIGILQGSL
jgi:hypothetical protein